MMAYRAVVVGTGFGGAVHVPAYVAHPAFELVGVAGIRTGTGAKLAAQYGVRGYDDWQDMLDREHPDVVSVVTAPNLHNEVSQYAIARGSHVICEKPMAYDLKEAAAMLEAARRAGVLGAINHEFRFMPARMALKKELLRGRIGDVLAVSLTQVSRRRPRLLEDPIGWLSRAEAGGGMLGAIGSHLIDSVRWWFGDIVAVSAELYADVPQRTTIDGRLERVSADDGFHLLLTLAGGAHAFIDFVSGMVEEPLTVTVQGTAGALRMRGDEDLEYAAADGEFHGLPVTPLDPGVPVPAQSRALVTNFLEFLNRFSALLTEHRQSGGDLATFEDGFHVQQVLDAARLSHQTGMRQRLWPL